jgi:hypothetical protein
MKIFDVKNRKDYYDSVAYSMGNADETILYKREEKSFKVKSINSRSKIGQYIEFPINDLYVNRGLSIFVIGFCGRTYVGAMVYEYETSTVSITYSYEEIINYIHERRGGVEGWRMFATLSRQQEDIEEVTDFFNKWNDVEHIELFHQLNTPIFLVGAKDYSSGRYGYSVPIYSNVILKDLKFFKIKDSFTAYQELETFMGGVLTNTELDWQPMNEKEAIQAKGFDKTHAFRKRKI